jgi:hypothetical protein
MKATVYFPPASLQRDAWFASAALDVIKAYRDGLSLKGPTVELSDAHYIDTGAADELFDMSNNPGRQEDRDEQWGPFRSLSTGDIVALDNGDAWLCQSMGWRKI